MNKNKTAVIIGSLVIAIGAGFVIWNSSNDEETMSSHQNDVSQQVPAEELQQTTSDIVELASGTSSLSTLVTAVQAGGLVETLQGEGPFTVFAPTNAGFEALPEGTVESLLKPENVDQLKTILTYHVVSGKVLSSDLSDGQMITTVQGGTLKVKINDSGVYIVDAKNNESKVSTADVDAKNGVVHIVESVLLPQ